MPEQESNANASHTDHHRMKWIIVLIAAIALVAGIVPVVLWLVIGNAGTGSAKFSVSGDKTEVRFIGTQLDGENAVFDAAGKLCCRMAGAKNPIPSPEHVEHARCAFLFETPPGENPVTFLSVVEIIPAGSGMPLPVSTRWSGDGSTCGTCYLFAALPEKYIRKTYISPIGRWLLHDTRALRSIDIKVYFWHGPRGRAGYTFAGPFRVGESYKPAEKYKAELTVKPAEGSGDVILQVLIGMAGYSPEYEGMAYGHDGRRHMMKHAGGETRADSFTLEYALQNIGLEDVTFITIAEHWREKTFHNIRIPEP